MGTESDFEKTAGTGILRAYISDGVINVEVDEDASCPDMAMKSVEALLSSGAKYPVVIV